MRLYDTAAAGGRAVRARAGRDDVHLRHHPLRRRPPRPRRDLPAFDILQRRLRDLGHETRCVRNVTDVDDDILRKARELGVHYLDLAAEEMARFDADMGRSASCPPTPSPGPPRPSPTSSRSSGSCSTGGHAYESGGSVYFDVSTFPAFGQLSHLDRARDARPGRRARRAIPTTPTSATRSTSCSGSPRCPTSRPGSRAGARAGPGWHIECSALALRELGRDHRPPRRRARPHLPPPRVRDGPVRVGHRASRSSGTGCTSAWSASTGRRCRSRSATSSSSATC